MKNILLIALVISAFTVSAQIEKNNKSELTIEKIMQDPDKWIGTSPDGIFWDESGKSIYFDWNPEHDTLSSLYAYNLKTKEINAVSIENKIKLPGRGAN